MPSMSLIENILIFVTLKYNLHNDLGGGVNLVDIFLLNGHTTSLCYFITA